MKTTTHILTLLLCLMFAGRVGAQSMKDYVLCLQMNTQSLEEKLQFKPIPIPDNIKEIVSKVEYWDMVYQWTGICNGEIFIKNTSYYDKYWYSTIQFIRNNEYGILHRTAKGSTLHHSIDNNYYPTRYIPFAYDGERLLVMFESDWNEGHAKENFPNINVPLVLLTPVGKDNFLKRIEIEEHPEASSEAAMVHNIPPRDIVNRIGLRPLPVDEKFFQRSSEEKKRPYKNIIYSTPNIRDTLYKVRYWRSLGSVGYTKWENGRVVFDDERILFFGLPFDDNYNEFDATKTYVKLHRISHIDKSYSTYKHKLENYTVSAYDGERIILSSTNDGEAFVLTCLTPASQEEIEILHLFANRESPILKYNRRLSSLRITSLVCRSLTTEPIGKVEVPQPTTKRVKRAKRG